LGHQQDDNIFKDNERLAVNSNQWQAFLITPVKLISRVRHGMLCMRPRIC